MPAPRTARVFEPALIEVVHGSVRACGPDDVGNRLAPGSGSAAHSRVAASIRRNSFSFRSASRSSAACCSFRFFSSKELGEDRDLGANHLRHERLDQVVDGSDLVALVDEVHVLRLGGQEERSGSRRCCSRCLMAAASSKPLISGITTSMSRTANSSSRSRRSASAPELASTIR